MDTKKYSKWILFGSAGAAAAAIYFGDPRDGTKRRAALSKSVRRLLQDAEDHSRKSVRDTAHHLQGMAARIWSSLRIDAPDDKVIEERIRSRMGRIVAHPRRIHVMGDHGVVTLWGQALRSEVPKLINAAKTTSGAREVHDHLEIAESPDPSLRRDELREARRDIRLNWSPSRRLAVGAAGAMLALYGLKRQDKLGSMTAMTGAGLIFRSAMRHRLLPLLALDEESPGYQLERTIRINAPISVLFVFGVIRENYPLFFSHVERIERLGENLFRWNIRGPAGIPITWEGVITNIIPNTLVAWKSLPGSSVAN